MTIFVIGLISLVSLAIVGVWGVRQVRRVLARLRRWATPGLIFSMSGLPLSDTDKHRFAALAIVRNCTQQALLAEAIRRVLAEQ